MKKLDEYHYHEALDRASSVAEIIEIMLIQHPVVKEHKDVKELVEKAQECILEAYQILGGLSI